MMISKNHGISYNIGYNYEPLIYLCFVVYATKGFISCLPATRNLSRPLRFSAQEALHERKFDPLHKLLNTTMGLSEFLFTGAKQMNHCALSVTF